MLLNSIMHHFFMQETVVSVFELDGVKLDEDTCGKLLSCDCDTFLINSNFLCSVLSISSHDSMIRVID